MDLSIQKDQIKYYPLGDAAIVIQFAEDISKTINLQIRATCAWLDEYTFKGFVEYVPAFTTITVYYEPWVINYTELLALLQEMINNISDVEEQPLSDVIEIPVLYGGENGPDLEFVASHHSMSLNEVIALHTAPEYMVYMIGFAPGFPYLGGMDERIATPRKENPRSKIFKGAVGIAGKQTGVYPIETPGGWQIIGRTPLELFSLEREEPALLKAGDRVRFVSITATAFAELKDGEDEY